MITYCQMTQNHLSETITCVERVLPYVDRVVIIDGGSIDDTIFYMRNWAKNEPKLEFYIEPWKDNFCEQRNNYLKRVEDNTWALISDPDELFEVELLEKLPEVIAYAEQNGSDMVGFQCRSVSKEGAKRTWENLDNYHKRLLYKKYPNTHYAGNPHEHLVNHPHKIMDTDLIYEHIKQENVIWHRGCFIPGTKVFTPSESRDIEELSIGDYVLDKNGEPKKITKTFEIHSTGDMYCISTRGAEDLVVTGEHPFLVAEGEHCKERGLNSVSYPRSQNNSCSCCSIEKDYTEYKWKRARDLLPTDIMLFPIPSQRRSLIEPPLKFIGGNHYKKEFEPIKMTNSFFYLCGVYLAEGIIESSRQDNNFDRVSFSLNSNEKETIGKELSNTIKTVFGNNSWYKKSIEKRKDNACVLQTSVKELGNWLERYFGKHAWEKKLPLNIVESLSDKELVSLLKGIFDGDGSLKQDNQTMITLASPHLINGIYLSLLKLGVRASWHKIPLKTLNNKNSGFLHRRDMYRITIPVIDQQKFNDLLGCKKTINKPIHSYGAWFADGYLKSTISKIEKVDYEGPVYNLEVEGTESYLVAGAISHNSRNMFVGGGGPNLGTKNPRWVKLRALCKELGINSWHEFDKYLLGGNIDSRIKEMMFEFKDLDGWDGASEHRELYKLYFDIYHPEEL